MVKNSQHTPQEIKEWFNAFYQGLHEAFILNEPKYSCLIDKIIKTQDLSVDRIIEIMTPYFKKNKLKYQIKERIKELEQQKKEVEKEPDFIPNDNKEMLLAEIEEELNELKNEINK